MQFSNTITPVHGEGVRTIMNINELNTIEALEKFLAGTQPVVFAIETDIGNRYAWIQKILTKFNYPFTGRHEKSIIKRYILKVTGYSRQQFTRFALQYRKNGKIQKGNKTTRTSFKRLYTPEDIRLLAQLDECHGVLSGPATKKLCERAHHYFEQKEYERLARISVAQIYNLRKSVGYRRQRWIHKKTKPKTSALGERRKPNPDGKPGYIRIDTVHQGDLDGEKGVYHINAVDEVTQFEVVCTVERISERYLIPVLEDSLSFFPFKIIGFHSDNGFEYVNRYVVALLRKLHVEFTKSRPRHSNDNALVECKNGAIVRKALGYIHIPQHWADQINEFNRKYLNPYINYHRPCFFPEIKIDDKGKQRKKYPYELMMTPYEKFKTLPEASQYLKEGLTFEILDSIERKTSDNEAAKQMQKAKSKLYQTIYQQKEAI